MQRGIALRVKDEHLRDELLHHAKEIASTDGYNKISMRELAKRAGIATGTVYNYFSSKDEILLALTDSYWRQVLDKMNEPAPHILFYNQLEYAYQFLCQHLVSKASELMGSLGNVQKAGQQRMVAMHQHLSKILLTYLNTDEKISDALWTETFTKEKYIDFITNNMMLSLRARATNIDFLIEIVKRTLY